MQFPMVRHAAEVGWTPVPPKDALAHRGGQKGLLFRGELEGALRSFNSWLTCQATALKSQSTHGQRWMPDHRSLQELSHLGRTSPAETCHPPTLVVGSRVRIFSNERIAEADRSDFAGVLESHPEHIAVVPAEVLQEPLRNHVMPFRPCRHTVSRLTPKVLAAALTDPPLEPRLVLRNPEVTRGLRVVLQSLGFSINPACPTLHSFCSGYPLLNSLLSRAN